MSEPADPPTVVPVVGAAEGSMRLYLIIVLAVLATASISTVAAQVQKWEYATLSYSNESGQAWWISPDVILATAEGVRDLPGLVRELAALYRGRLGALEEWLSAGIRLAGTEVVILQVVGAGGWELVTTTPYTYPAGQNVRVHLLKRPIQ